MNTAKKGMHEKPELYVCRMHAFHSPTQLRTQSIQECRVLTSEQAATDGNTQLAAPSGPEVFTGIPLQSNKTRGFFYFLFSYFIISNNNSIIRDGPGNSSTRSLIAEQKAQGRTPSILHELRQNSSTYLCA
jgi:hypothetical protein